MKTLNSAAFVAACGMLTSVAFSSMASAQSPNAVETIVASQPASARTGGYASVAKVAALVEAGGNLNRAVNVKMVRHPSTGTYCIVPSTRLNKSDIYPMVTVEYGYSGGAALAAFVNDTASDCPVPGDIEVLTYDFSQNRSDSVAFYLFVL